MQESIEWNVIGDLIREHVDVDGLAHAILVYAGEDHGDRSYMVRLLVLNELDVSLCAATLRAGLSKRRAEKEAKNEPQYPDQSRYGIA